MNKTKIKCMSLRNLHSIDKDRISYVRYLYISDDKHYRENQTWKERKSARERRKVAVLSKISMGIFTGKVSWTKLKSCRCLGDSIPGRGNNKFNVLRQVLDGMTKRSKESVESFRNKQGYEKNERWGSYKPKDVGFYSELDG